MGPLICVPISAPMFRSHLLRTPLHICLLSSAALFHAGAAMAQPLTDIGLFAGTAPNTVEVRLRPDAAFSQVVSSLTFTVRWETASGATIDPPASLSLGLNCPSGIPLSPSSDGVRTDGAFSYYTFNAFGFSTLTNACPTQVWQANVERVIATIPVGPADSEGGLTTSKDAVWIVSDPKGVLTRIDPKTNKPVAEITIPAGSVAAHFAAGFVWVTANKASKLIQIDAKKNAVVREIEVGPSPRFLTSGAGSVWTVNQGDGSVTRVDAKSGAIQAKIEAGIPGPGGEVSFGGGGLWITVFDIPITFIDAKTNTVTKQWTGPGGDAIRFGLNSVWLSNLRQQNLWRIDPKKL